MIVMERQYRKVPDCEKQALRPELENIWKKCFFDTDEGTKFVFENIYPDSRCYCCFTDDICCASLYIIYGEIEDKKGVLQRVHYLFGAATLPEYRKGGIMSSLIEYALMDSFKEGHKASVLLPANEGLYSYYGKLGYVPLYGTDIRDYELLKTHKSEKIPLIYDEKEKTDNIIKLRKTAKQPVQVMQFPDKTVKNALGYNSIYNGFSLSGEDFYMTVQSSSKEAVVTEFISEKPVEEVLNSVFSEFDDIKKITVRVPCCSENKFGMINVLDKSVEFSHTIYIGLTKD